MTTDSSPYALPYLAQIFEALSHGKHLCAGDGNLFAELRQHEAAFEALFQHLGYQMISDARGFYYFYATDMQNVSPRTAKLAVFFLVLIEALWEDVADVNELESRLLDRAWNISELPHLNRERYLEIMKQLDKEEPDISTMRDIMKQFVYFGFAEAEGDDAFRFRTPALRFFDMAREVAESLEKETTLAGSDTEVAA